MRSPTYRGPVWVSKGENYRPLGVYNYITNCLRTLQSQLEPLLKYKAEVSSIPISIAFVTRIWEHMGFAQNAAGKHEIK